MAKRMTEGEQEMAQRAALKTTASHELIQNMDTDSDLTHRHPENGLSAFLFRYVYLQYFSISLLQAAM